mmetsp:Transcript_5588/g.18631  ORF Transcript_5588/g.18631 Transcript_5588/m.18631 type:complete len:205 (+) Transcript_5588:1098-1712(+)
MLHPQGDVRDAIRARLGHGTRRRHVSGPVPAAHQSPHLPRGDGDGRGWRRAQRGHAGPRYLRGGGGPVRSQATRGSGRLLLRAQYSAGRRDAHSRRPRRVQGARGDDCAEPGADCPPQRAGARAAARLLHRQLPARQRAGHANHRLHHAADAARRCPWRAQPQARPAAPRWLRANRSRLLPARGIFRCHWRLPRAVPRPGSGVE